MTDTTPELKKCAAYFLIHDAVKLAREAAGIPKNAKTEIEERKRPVAFTTAKAATKKAAVAKGDEVVGLHGQYDFAALPQARRRGAVLHVRFSKPGSGGDAGPEADGTDGVIGTVVVWVGTDTAGPRVLK